MPIQIEQYACRVDGVRVAYQAAGAGQSVVLIHGLATSGRCWARNVAALAAHFRVYIVDLPGFGASRSTSPFVLDQAAGILARWLAQIGVARAHVVGHSMGGLIAADLAAAAPECVAHLVLVDPALLLYGSTLWSRIRGFAGLARYTAFDSLPRLAFDVYRSGPRTIWSSAQALLALDLRPKLAHIHAPTLIVWGAHDTFVPVAGAPLIAQAISGAQITMIAGAGHSPMWERAEDFNRVVLDFLHTT